MTAKEIWYVWSGKGVTPNSRDVMGSLLRNGLYVTAGNALNWGWLNSDYDVVAYTIGEKRERVECHSCKGSGVQVHEGVTGKCWLCKGVGKISEGVV